MGKGIYTYYKERLIEITGNNKCLYLKNVTKRSSYDIGRLFEGRDDKIAEFIANPILLTITIDGDATTRTFYLYKNNKIS